MSLVDKARDLFNKSQPVFSPHKCISNLKLAKTRIIHQIKKCNALLSQNLKEIVQMLKNEEFEPLYNKTRKLLEIQSNIKALKVLDIVCETILLGFGSLDLVLTDEIEDAIHNLVYASARLDLQELKIITNQLKIKFGQKYIMDCLRNKGNRVDQRLTESLSLAPISDDNIKNILRNIAHENGIEIQIVERLMNFTEHSISNPSIIEFPNVPDHEVIITYNQFLDDSKNKKDENEEAEFEDLMERLSRLKQ